MEQNIRNNHVNTVTIRDMCNAVAKHLRGTLRPTEQGFRLEISNEQRFNYSTLEVSRSLNSVDCCNLNIEMGSLRHEAVYIKAKILEIDHLYVTWETPHLVSFFYLSEDHFCLVNIASDACVGVLSDLDRRKNEKTGNNSMTNCNRRVFYHVGSDKVKEPKSQEDEG